jgi:hypothetical protein
VCVCVCERESVCVSVCECVCVCVCMYVYIYIMQYSGDALLQCNVLNDTVAACVADALAQFDQG